MDLLKETLVEYGPLSVTHPYWSHAFSLVGIDVIEPGEFIDYETDEVVEDTSHYLGETYYIHKNSSIACGWPHHTGYIYTIDPPRSIYKLHVPIAALNLDNSDIQCFDKDNDGYYYWGIGAKPSVSLL